MSIFDLFSFKKKFAEVATKENFDFLRKVIKEEIKKQAKDAGKKGIEKMDAVVQSAEEYIHKYMHSDNKIVQGIIDIFAKGVRSFAQSIYEDLKEIVEGL